MTDLLLKRSGSTGDQYEVFAGEQHQDRTPAYGYEASREAAMQAFARSWNRN